MTRLNSKKCTIQLPDVDFWGDGVAHKVEVNLELYSKDGRPVLSICGDITGEPDCYGDTTVCCGQIDDTLREFYKDLGNELCDTILRLWDSYHLNDMNAGTPAQETILDKARKELGSLDYHQACKILEEAGMLYDEYEGEKVKYGSRWLYYPIPSEDLQVINDLIDKYKEQENV